MSLLPFLLNDDMPGLQRHRPYSLFDQNFGLSVLNDDLIQPRLTSLPLLCGYYRKWRHQVARLSGTSNIQNSRKGFKINLDVLQFKPNEISVKMVENFIVIEAKHEEHEDEHGLISRQFLRRYKLPDDVEPDTVSSKLSSDGILTIEASKKALSPADSKERVINITHTNAPAISHMEGQGVVKENTQEKMNQ